MLRFLGRADPDKENPEGRLLTYFPGIPARDLTADEVEELDKGVKNDLLASGLYREVGRKKVEDEHLTKSTPKVEDVMPVKESAKDKSA